MAECVKCRTITKYDTVVCYKCFDDLYSDPANKKLVDTISHKINEIYRNFSGEDLSNDDADFRERLAKGKIAESIIHELFERSDYDVFCLGMENSIPELMPLLKYDNSEIGLVIRNLPDFVVKSRKSNKLFFVEVKFTADGEFNAKDLPKDYPYTNAYIIHVSKKHIKCLKVSELLEGKEITPSSNNYLGNRKEFDLEKEVIIEYCKFAVQFFEKV